MTPSPGTGHNGIQRTYRRQVVVMAPEPATPF